MVLAGLACQFNLGGPTPPGDPIPTQAEAADILTQMWQSAIESAAASGQVMIILDEIQLTSLLSQRLEALENPALLEPQVYLRENAIQIYGTTEQGPFKANVLFSVTPVVSPEGNLSFELKDAEFGPIPAPTALKDTISAILTEAFTGTIGSLASGIRVTSLAITDGQMAIVGELR